MSAGQSIFQNELINTLPYTSPNIKPATIFNTGASQIQTSFSAADLLGIDSAYMRALHLTFALAIPMAGMATLVALAQRWFRLKTPEKDKGAQGDNIKAE